MDSHAFLRDFIAAHRGTRMGRLFGVPAAFVGRRPFARLSGRGIEYRVGPAGSKNGWVLARPRIRPEYLRLAHQLELAIQRTVGPRTENQRQRTSI